MESRMSSLVLERIFCRPLVMEKGGVLRTVPKEGKGCGEGQSISGEEQHWEGSVRDIVRSTLSS